MSGPYSHSGREDALFFQLILDLRQILFDKHKAQAHQQQRAGKPDRPLAEDADALCADACIQRKNKDNSKNLLQYASKRLGTDVTAKGGTYVPTFNNQELANKPVVNVSVQKDNESIRVLQDQLTQMKEQTSLLMNNLGNSGNTTVIATQVSADQVLQILQQNPAALQNILGRNKSNGWR